MFAVQLLLASLAGAHAFITPNLPLQRPLEHVLSMQSESCVTRKELLQAGVMSLGCLALSTAPASADVEEVPLARTKLGGLLEPFSDISKGFKLLRPSGWNQFDGVVGEYEVKFVDLVNPSEVVQVSTTPVKSDTQLENLGGAEAVGSKLAKARGVELVSSRERKTEGILYYDLEFKGERMHELRSLCINKSKLWSLTEMAPERNWGKRENMMRTLQVSFTPKL